MNDSTALADQVVPTARASPTASRSPATRPAPQQVYRPSASPTPSPQAAASLLQQQKVWQADANRLRMLLKEREEALQTTKEELAVYKQVTLDAHIHLLFTKKKAEGKT